MQPFARYLRRFVVGVVLAAAALLLRPASASAAFELAVEFELNGIVVAPTTVPPNQSLETTITPPSTTLAVSNIHIIGNGTALNPEFMVTLTMSTSNSNGTPSDASLSLQNISITTGSTYKANDNLTILASAQGYNQPVSPPDLMITVGGTGLSTANDSKVTYNYGGGIDQSDSLFGLPAGTSVTNKFTTNQSTLPTLTKSASVTTTPYSETLFVGAQFAASGGNQVLTGTLANLDATTPAPPGLVLALTGLPLAGIGWLRRRLKKRA